MEVHNAASAGAYVAQDHAAEVSALGTCGTRQGDRDTLVRKRQAQAKHLGLVSAADPWGDGLSRSLTNKAAVCWVGAPSLRPPKAGARGPTDRRDARPLARHMRSGALPPGYGPAVDEAARRDLSRAREETLRALQAATRWRNAFVLRHDSRFPGRAPWRLWAMATQVPLPPQA